MANTSRPAGVWQWLRSLPDRTPLRTKLITAVLALVALALVVITVLGNAILKDYLLGPYDNQVTTLANGHAQGWVFSYVNGGGQLQSGGLAVDWVSGGKIQRVVLPVGTASVRGSGAPGNISQSYLPGPDIQASPAWLAANSNHLITLPAASGSGHWRAYMVPAQVTNTTSGAVISGTIVVATDVSSVYTTTGQLATIDVLIGLVVLVLLGVAGFAVIRASLRPLTEIEETAETIAAGDLTRRVPERDPGTEVGSLGRSLNAMLSQIEAAFDARAESEDAARQSEEAARESEGRMRQFLADASHELRTPLTAIRGFAEYYRQRGGVRPATVPDADAPSPAGNGTNGAGRLAPADLDRIMRRVEQEAARMGILVEDMLLLARLDQQRPLERGTVDLLTLAADAVHDARVVAPARTINLTVGAGAALLVNGDEVRLRQVIGNLMSNALSHTPDGTPIDVLIRSGSLAEIQAATAAAGAAGLPPRPVPGVPDAGQETPETDYPHIYPVTAGAQSAAVLEVTDHGPGLTEEQAQHAFERFYRGDTARTTGGTGLGLAIVAALVAAHGGAVWVRTRPGEGATFAIALPLAPEAVREAGTDEENDDPQEDDQVQDHAWADSGPSGPAAT